MAKTMRKHNKKSRRPRRQNGRKTRRMRMRKGGIFGFGKPSEENVVGVVEKPTQRVVPDYSAEIKEVMDFLSTKPYRTQNRIVLIEEIISHLKNRPDLDKYSELLKIKIDGFSVDENQKPITQSILSIILFYMTSENLIKTLPVDKSAYINYMLTYIIHRIKTPKTIISLSSIQGLINLGITAMKKGIPPN